MSEEVEVLKRILERERKARKEAEKIIGQKSFELEVINAHLESLVEQRTQELELLAKFPAHDPSPVLRIQSDGIIDYANLSSQKLLKFWNTNIGESCPPSMQIIIQKCFQRNLNIEIEVTDTLDDDRIYLFILSPVKEHNFVFAYGRDITALKKTQTELDASKNLYKQLVEESSDIIHRTNLKGDFIYVNPSAKDLVEYETEELLGTNYLNLLRKDYIPKAKKLYRDQLNENIQETYFEFPIVSKSGKEFWIGQNSKIIYKNKYAAGFHSVSRDITERKLTELELESTTSRLKALLSCLQSGILVEDENRKVVLTNEIFCSQFKIPLLPTDMVGMDCKSVTEQSYDLIKESGKFASRVNTILKEKQMVLGEEIELHGNIILERDYIPIYSDGYYMGHLWNYRDITEKKIAEQKIKEQKEFYEGILNSIPTDISVFDKNHRYIFLNPQAMRNAELRKWIIGKDDFDYMEYTKKPVDIATERRALFKQAFEQKKMLKWEEQQKGHGGETVYKLRHMCPILNDHNEVEFVIGLGLDISNEKTIENELRRNERLLNIVNKISYELIIGSDFENSLIKVFKYISKETHSDIHIYKKRFEQEKHTSHFEHYFGINEESNPVLFNIQGNTSLHSNIFSDENCKLLSTGKAILQSIDSESAFVESHEQKLLLLPVITNNDLWGVIIFEDSAQSQKWDNPQIDILQSLANAIGGVISRKKSEEKLKAIVTSLDDIVLQINKKHEYEHIWVSNNSNLRFPKEKYLNKNISEVVSPELAKIFIPAIDEVLATQETRTFNYLSPDDGRYFYAKICYLNPDSVSALFQDVTQQKLAEIELVKAREKAEHSVKAKEHFLANMSHEIRTPMNAILGMSNLLFKTTLTSKQQSYLNAIKISSENLLIIINDILDFSKIESEKLHLEKIGFSIREVIHNLIQTTQHKTLEKNLFLEHFIDENISPVLIGDPVRLQQILLNLINNAIKFTKEGGIELKCILDSTQDDKQIIYFSVTDTGIGIRQDKLQTIFESFTQEDETITRKYGGTGLGLSICKELVEMQGGTIRVVSQKNTGTQFSFTLEYPTGTPNDLPQEKQTIVLTEELQETHILLVEDNEINQFLAQTILENHKMTVDLASNGAMAIDKIKNNHYDLILMDMQMPIMGGVEASRIIRQELQCQTPIIALTANAIKGDDKICLDAGMNEYISKPFNEEELIAKIAGLIRINKNPEIKKTPELTEINIKTIYNLEKLKSMARNNNGFVHKMANLFVEQTPAALAKIKQHFYSGETDQIKAIAHSIKPSIDILSIQESTDDIRKLEQCVVNEMSNQAIETLILKLEKRINLIVEDLKISMEELKD